MISIVYTIDIFRHVPRILMNIDHSSLEMLGRQPLQRSAEAVCDTVLKSFKEANYMVRSARRVKLKVNGRLRTGSFSA